MNKPEEIQTAFLDYQLGRNGFENALSWKSERSKSRIIWRASLPHSLFRRLHFHFYRIFVQILAMWNELALYAMSQYVQRNRVVLWRLFSPLPNSNTHKAKIWSLGKATGQYLLKSSAKMYSCLLTF